MMNPQEVLTMIGGLAAMKFFPSGDVEARIAIAEQFARFATSEEQVRWTIQRLIALHREWPGVHELRAVFCSRWKPADGIEAHSSVYLDGIPSEKEHPQLSAPPVAQLNGDIAPDVTFPRDALDLVHEAIERAKRIRNTPLPSQEEIEAIKQQQETQRAGDAAVIESEAKLKNIAGVK